MSTPTKPYVSDDQIRQMEAGKFMSERPYEMNYEQGAKDMRELYEARIVSLLQEMMNDPLCDEMQRSMVIRPIAAKHGLTL